jgi:DNA-binding LacI/PurR family transcriptional regulator
MANVSPMTVSNVINGRKNLVREETRKRVLEAVIRLEYRPNLRGRALRLSQSWLIGFVIIYESDSDFLASPWTSRLVSAMARDVNRKSYSLLFHNCRENELSEADLRRFADTDALCLMVSGTNTKRNAIINRFLTLQRPILALQEPNDPPFDKDVAYLRQDDFGGGYLLATHLYEQSARKIAFLKPAEPWPAMDERIRGIRDFLATHPEMSFDIIQIDTGTYDDVHACIKSYIDHNGLPDAIMAANEQLAYSVSAVMKNMELSVPDDVMLTAFNAFDLWRYSDNRITTVEVPVRDMGAKAGEFLLHRIAEGRFPDKTTVFPLRLLVGDSTGGGTS